MKRLLPKLARLIALLACISFFGCKNDSSDDGPSKEHYAIYTLGQLMGKYGALLEKEANVKQLNSVPNSLTMISDIPSDEKQSAWLLEAFNSGIPIGLLDANEEELIKFSDFFGLDIDFNGALSGSAANSSNAFVARKDEAGNIYSIDAGFDSRSYVDESEKIGTEVIPDSEVLPDTPNPFEQQPNEADIENAIIKELLKWAFEDSPKMMAEASEMQINANANFVSNSANLNLRNSPENIDLQKLATAHCPRHIIPTNYRFGPDGDLFFFPIIVIDYKIYSLHDFTNNKDYYVMEKSTTRDASPHFQFYDQAPKSNPLKWNKIIHWNASVNTAAELNTNNVKLTDHHPTATRSEQQVSESFNWNLGANISGGYSWQENTKGASVSGGINAGFGFTKTNTWTLKDLYVQPSLDGRKLAYNYSIPMEQFVPNRNDPIEKVPEIAKSTLATKEMWLWTVENPGETLMLKGTDNHTVGRRQYSCFAAGGQRWRYLTQNATYSFAMRVPPHFTFSTPTRTNQIVLDKDGKLLNNPTYAQIGVFAHQNWTLESNQTWLTPSMSSGSGLTESNAITLSCDSNGSRTQRTATLTAKTTIEGKQQVITCEVIQAGNPEGLPAGEVFRVSSNSIALDKVVAKPEVIQLSAAENWTAETGARWCRVYQFSGAPCKDQDFKIKASANTTGADRSTVVTFRSSSGQTCEVKVMQYAD